MPGYDWNKGKSNNAVYAELSGRVPKSKINASLLKQFDIPLTVKDTKKLIELDVFKSSEWHHTSKEFNETYFYDLEILKEMCDDEEEFAEAKRVLKEEKEEDAGKNKEKDKTIYAHIEYVEFEKKRGSWNPIFLEVVAEIKGYYSKTMCTVNTTNNDSFRKKRSNITIKKFIDFKKFDNEKRRKLKEWKDGYKEDFLKRISEHIPKIDDALVLKFKKARSVSVLRELKDEITSFIDKLKEEEQKRLKKIKEEEQIRLNKIRSEKLKELEKLDISDWILLPREMQHPAPKKILDMKISSGLSWNDFEEFMKNK